MSDKFQSGDRVVRRGVPGPAGTVQKVRVETTRESLRESKEGEEPPAVTVTVVWDNGTISHFVPEGLERAQ